MFEFGALFGKYRILSLIGRGGMGTVYLAEDVTLGRKVALKVLDRTFAESAEFEQRFLREARTIASLQHPNIVTIHAMEKIDDILAIEMPYIDGGSLTVVMENPKKDPGLCVSCVHDALMALARCHAEGIVHRDVKPSNILLRGDGVALLSDFGLAKVAAEQEALSISAGSSSGYFLGTPRYAPPESWDGQEATPAWDVYSCGMMLYEAFAPSIPYDSSTLIGLVKQVVEKPIPPLADVAGNVSKELSDAVAAMLCRDPAQRPQDAAAALELLNVAPEWRAHAHNGARTVAIRTPRPKPLRKPGGALRRLSGRSKALAALVLLFTAGWGAFLIGRTTTAPAVVPVNGPVIPATPVSVSPFVVFDTVDPAEGVIMPAHVLLLAPERADTWSALAHESTRVWTFKVIAQTSGGFGVTGYWAGYNDSVATLFQHGEITGSGRWTVPDVEMTVSLEFRNLLDGSRRTRALVLKRSAQPVTEVDFINRFVSSDFAQPLLYNEVMPRRLAWARDLETHFIGRTATRVAVLALTPQDGAIVVDGDLTGSPWPSSILDAGDEQGAVAGRGNGAPRLFFRADEKGLYVAVQIHAPGNDPHLRVSIMPGFEIPVARSPRWSAVVGKDGIETSRLKRDSNASPWQCTWQAASRAADLAWQAELYIPFDSMEGVSIPVSGTRWRMNCSITLGSGPETAPIAQWGSTDTLQVQQGLILIFGERGGL